MEEVWKVIDSYSDYLISSFGRVKSLRTNIVLKQDIGIGGYKRVTLYSNTKPKHHLVHRLVAKSFIDNPNNLPEINHKDNNPGNNIVTNLEWCTSRYNSRYSKSKPVNQYTADGKYIKTWSCIREADETLNIDNSSISRCCKSKQNFAGGFIWRYAEPEVSTTNWANKEEWKDE